LQNSILSIQKSSEEKKEELKDLIKSKSELNHKIEQAKEGMIGDQNELEDTKEHINNLGTDI